MNTDILKQAISTYGTKPQIDMAIEEMSELTKALCKERRTDIDISNHPEFVANIIEEIADVLIMMQQLIIIFDCEDEVKKEIQFKIDRLEQRLLDWKE